MSGRKIGDLIIRIGADSYNFVQKIGQVDRELKAFAKKTETLGKQISMYFSAPLAAIGTASLMMSGKFDKSMREVSTLSNDISRNLTGFSADIVNMTKQVPIGADAAAKALYQIVSAGHDGAQGMKVLEVSARAAIAGVTDVTTAADAITTLLNAYKISAKNAEAISDQLFTTVRLGKTTFGQLGTSIAQVAPIAASFGIETEQILAAVATLTKSGTPTAQAMTQIRAAIIAASKVLGDGAFETQTFQAGLAKIADMAGGSESKLRALIPEIEGMNGVLGLTGKNAVTAASDLVELTNSAGASEVAYSKMMDGFLNKYELFKNKIHAIIVQIGQSLIPIAEAVMGAVGRMAESFSNLDAPTRNAIVLIAGVTASIGPLLLAVSGVVKVFAAMKVGALVMLNPIMLAIEAIGLLIVAVYKWNNLTADTMESWENQQLSLKNWTVDEAVKAYENSNKELSRLKEERKKIVSQINSYNKNPKESGISYEEVSLLRRQLMELPELVKAQENVIASRLKLIDTVKNQTSATSGTTASTTGGIINDLNNQIAELQKKKLLPETSEADIKTINQEIAVLEQKLSKLNGTQIKIPGVEKATGMIARLTEQVAQFEKAKAAATSTGQIAAFNEKIAETKTKIESLNAVTAQYLATRQQANATPGVAVGMQIADAKIAPKIQVNPILQFIKSSNEIAGKIGEYINGITKDGAIPMQAAKMGLFIKKQIELNVSKGFKLNVATDLAISSANNIIGVVNEMNSILSSNVANAVSGIAKSIGSMMVGDMGFDGLLQGIAGQVGNFFIQLGELAIKVGTTMEAFKEAMTALVENPFVMIAIGVGMVILGQVLSSILNKKAEGSVPKLANGGIAYGATYAMVGDNYNARVDPEVIAPLSKLKSMMLPSQSSGSFPDKLKFVIEGDKLVGVLSKYQKKLKYT